MTKKINRRSTINAIIATQQGKFFSMRDRDGNLIHNGRIGVTQRGKEKKVYGNTKRGLISSFNAQLLSHERIALDRVYEIRAGGSIYTITD